MNIDLIAEEINAWAKKNGFYEPGRTRDFDGLIALVHSEASEALEEWRDGHDYTEIYYNEEKPGKPEGIPTELADIIIRVLDMSKHYGIDIEQAIRIKMDYNHSRPYRNGNKRS